jgi:inner membrane transporter RhtA
VPPTALVLLAVLSVQLGSTIAKNLFDEIGPGGATFLRVGFGALILLVVWRPGLSGRSVVEMSMAALFGLAIAAMNLSFYSALDRIPLGVAVTLEFIGPLALAIGGSRRPLDVIWVTLGAAGIALLTPWGDIHLDDVGVALALLAGLFWAAYIVLSARVGRIFPGGRGLALAMATAAIVTLPVGLVGARTHLLLPRAIIGGMGVALLSAVIPYSLELEALRSIPTRVFGVLMSLEPGVAAVVGFIVLGQVLGTRAVVALILVSAASIGATRYAGSTL